MTLDTQNPAVVSVPLIPRTVLFGNPEQGGAQLSGDGKWMTWLAPHEGVLNVWIRGVHEGADEARVLTADRDRGVRSYFWAPDHQRILYIQDVGGDENWRLYDVDIATGITRDLTPFEEVQVQMVAAEDEITDRILIGLNKDDARLHDVYSLDLASGELTLVMKNPGFIGFVADAQLRVRAAMAPQPDGSMVLLTRVDEDSEWDQRLVVDHEDSLTTSPVGFDTTGERLLMISSVNANTARLLWLDIASGAEEVIAEDPQYDVANALMDEATRTPAAVAFSRDRMQWQALRADYEPVIEAMCAIDGGDVHVLSRTNDDSVWIIGTDHADGPTRYYRHVPALPGQATSTEFLWVNRPELQNYQLAPMQPFSFTASDGLTIHGYVTVPVMADGTEPTNLPAVLNVHGGPWARDAWGFDPEAQWMANRGYVCIQVNFRGSTGYGKSFINAGDREWGAAMHQDLLDAVEHFAGQGLIDRSRTAIYGGSYGGYAALAGAAFTPDAFCASVDIVGPSNLITLIQSIPPYWEPLVAQFHRRVGHPENDADFLRERSPLTKAADIRIPLLIAQGANDPRVKQAESEQIVAALKENEIAHEYLLFEDEGHGFAKPENRLKFYAAAEQFLAQHVGGRCEP